MIFRKYTAVSLALALVAATSLPASAASGFLHFGATKQQSDPTAVRKLTPSQSALIDRAVVREHAVVAAVKDRAPLVETYIQNMRPDPVVTQYPASDRYFLDRVAVSTGRCNTGLKFTRRRLKAQGLSRALIETQRDLIEMGLRVDGQVRFLRKVLS